MISESQFIKEFSKLEASFNRSVKAEVKDGWYEEIGEKVNFIPYARAINTLKMQEFFPKFKDFWAVYRVEAKRQGSDESTDYCGFCLNGMLYVWQIHKGTGDEISAVGFCLRCHPDRNPTIDPLSKSVRFQFDHAKEYQRQKKADIDFREHIKTLWKSKMQAKFSGSDPSNEAKRKSLSRQEGYGVETFSNAKDRHENFDIEQKEASRKYEQQEMGL